MTIHEAGLTHRHTDYETREILRVNPETGEVTKRRPIVTRKSRAEQHIQWEAARRADPSLPEDAAKAAAPAAAPEVAPEAAQKPPRKPGSGRTKKTTPNPIANYAPLLFSLEVGPLESRAVLLPWAEDIIQGSIITSADVSNGKVNVRASAVTRALCQAEITTAGCQAEGVALRTAQRIAKAARHAAHGIASYLERHPKIKAALDEELDEQGWWVRK